MPYNWKGDALAKLMILVLVLVLLVNSGIIIGFQLMTDYTLKSGQEALTPYGDYNVVDSFVRPELSAHLLAAPAKQNRLVLTEKHFLFNRHQVLLDQEVERNFSTEVKGDQGKIILRLDGQSKIGNVSVRFGTLPLRISTLQLRIPVGFFLWNLALLTAELLMGYLIHKIRNG